MSSTPTPEGHSRYAGFESVPIAVTVRVGLARVSVARLAELAPGDTGSAPVEALRPRLEPLHGPHPLEPIVSLRTRRRLHRLTRDGEPLAELCLDAVEFASRTMWWSLRMV